MSDVFSQKLLKGVRGKSIKRSIGCVMLTYFNIETYIVKRTKDVMSDARFHLNPSGHTQRSSEDRFDVNSKQEMYV